jgi:tRNA (guanosine-2'-O-)-methyltransferase
MQRSQHRREKILRVLAQRQPDLTVVMENIHDPHNVSAVLRSCDAVGIMQVELLYDREKFPSIGRKSSSSASKWLTKRRHKSVDNCYKVLRAEGFKIYATLLGEKSRSLYELDLTQKVALVFGNEHRGVSEEAAAKADLSFHVPMHGMVQSLNVSVACAVCLYEAFRQRLRSGNLSKSKLSGSELTRFYSDWIGR